MTSRALLLTLAAGVLAATSVSGGRSATTGPVPPAKARRIAAVWGAATTYVPGWAPRGVVLTHWRSESCACAMDDNRLIVQFARRWTRLDWEVADPREVDRVKERITCDGRRTVFHRLEAGSEIAWICRRGLAISVRQSTLLPGRLRTAELERMVASAHRTAPGRMPGASYELPSRSEVHRMAVAYGRRLLLPTRLPAGFVFSDWEVVPQATRGIDDRRTISLTFGRDSLYSRLGWTLFSGGDTNYDCPAQASRGVQVNEGIHGMSVWKCLPSRSAGNAKPLEISVWYDIRLHSPAMLRLVRRMIETARP